MSIHYKGKRNYARVNKCWIKGEGTDSREDYTGNSVTGWAEEEGGNAWLGRLAEGKGTQWLGVLMCARHDEREIIKERMLGAMEGGRISSIVYEQYITMYKFGTED